MAKSSKVRTPETARRRKVQAINCIVRPSCEVCGLCAEHCPGHMNMRQRPGYTHDKCQALYTIQGKEGPVMVGRQDTRSYAETH